MISKGDLVKMRLSVGTDENGKPLIDLFILGQIKNYAEDEETYIVEPRMISVSKEHISEIVPLPADFDFEDVSMELNVGEQKREKQKPAEVTDIRFYRPSS